VRVVRWYASCLWHMQRLQGPTAALLTDPEWHDFLFHQIETEYALRSGRMLEDVQVGAAV
jgi:hypothetical protein